MLLRQAGSLAELKLHVQSLRQPVVVQFQPVSLSWALCSESAGTCIVVGLTRRCSQSVYTESSLPSSTRFVPLELSSTFPAPWIALNSSFCFFKLERLAFSVGVHLPRSTDSGTCPQAFTSCKNQGSLPVSFLFFFFFFTRADSLPIILHTSRSLFCASYPEFMALSTGGPFGKELMWPLLGQKQSPPGIDFCGGKSGDPTVFCLSSFLISCGTCFFPCCSHMFTELLPQEINNLPK